MISVIKAAFILLPTLLFIRKSGVMAHSTSAFDSRSQRLFSGDLFTNIVDMKSKQNVVYSPASIYTCLALTYLGAAGNTSEEIRKVLKLEQEDKSVFASVYGNFFKTTFLRNIQPDDNAPQLKMSTRFYVNNQIKILQQFNKLAQEVFGCEAENVDFSQASTAVKNINKWVEDQTEKKITNLLQEDAVDADTSSILVNAIYFKAKWLHPFSAESTTKQVFHTSSHNQAQVDTMYTDDSFGYAELPELKAKVLKMPYENSNISMLIILPDSIEGLEELERNLKGMDISEITSKLVVKSVDVYLPKFRIEIDIDLKKTLETMGCSSMFSQNANLTAIFESDVPQKISDIKHKAYLDCNEAGSEAAAATFLKIVPMSLDLNKKTFRADHPFIFMICDENAIYFAGHVTNL